MIKAYAKANLILKVVGKNELNYHLLQMLNIRINIYDEIEVKKINQKKDQIKFLNSTLSFKKDTLVLDVLQYFKEYFGIQDCFEIVITKNIPIGAGLGGGSCDVGAILNYLSHIYHVNVFEDDFIYHLKQFGADILYALYMEPCIVEGIGDKITITKFRFNQEFIYIYPNIIASTKEVFKNNKVFHQKISHRELIDSIEKKGIYAFNNDLEEACEQTYPKFKTIIDEIRIFGHATMSGSGSSILLFCEEVDKTYDELTKKYADFYIKKVRLVEE